MAIWRVQAVAAVSLCALAYGQLSFKTSVVIGETCTATCASYGLACDEAAFPSTPCQGYSMMDGAPELAEYSRRPVVCEGGSSTTAEDFLCSTGSD